MMITIKTGKKIMYLQAILPSKLLQNRFNISENKQILNHWIPCLSLSYFSYLQTFSWSCLAASSTSVLCTCLGAIQTYLITRNRITRIAITTTNTKKPLLSLAPALTTPTLPLPSSKQIVWDQPSLIQEMSARSVIPSPSTNFTSSKSYIAIFLLLASTNISFVQRHPCWQGVSVHDPTCYYSLMRTKFPFRSVSKAEFRFPNPLAQRINPRSSILVDEGSDLPKGLLQRRSSFNSSATQMYCLLPTQEARAIFRCRQKGSDVLLKLSPQLIACIYDSCKLLSSIRRKVRLLSPCSAIECAFP